MTKHELVDAYIQGRIDRRDFIARLTGLGVSAAAAVAYAASFAPSAHAAAGRTKNGYVVRLQDTDFDDEYGAPIGACEALDVLIDVAERMNSRLGSLRSLNQGLRQVLQRFEDRLQLLQDLQEARCGTAGRRPSSLAAFSSTLLSQNSNSEKQERLDLLKYVDTIASLYAYIVPSVEEDDVRSSMMSAAMAIARDAEVVRRLIGEDPSDGLLQRPLSPEEAYEILDELDAEES